MPTTSERTLRIQGLVSGTTIENLQDAVGLPIKSKRRFVPSSSRATTSQAHPVDEPHCFLAQQNDYMTSTVSFSSAKEKKEAVERLNKNKAKEWQIDADFIGLTIVTQASAGFYNHGADKILNVDHHQICKFDTPFSPAYINVLARLKKLRTLLLTEETSNTAKISTAHNIPGQPPIVAPHYPLNEHSKWYEGRNLRNLSQLVGRTDHLKQIIDSLQQPDAFQVIALTGTGGAGKTEILLEVAFRLKNAVNIFSIRPTDAKSLDLELLQIAVSIGHDLLSIRFKNADLASIWRTYNPDERIQAFKAWIAHEENQPCVFIVDDVDGLCDDDLIAAALPSQAQAILYSARDPTILDGLDRPGKAYHISDMNIDELVSLMAAILKKLQSRIGDCIVSEVELKTIAKIVSGHPLGACRAIAYILNVLSQTSDNPATTFIQAFSVSNWRARRDFIEYKPRFGLSIIEAFTTSYDRMQRPRIETERLLELIAFLTNGSPHIHFRDFFDIERPWLANLRSDLPDYDMFTEDSQNMNKYLLELERTSIGIRQVVPGPLVIHPLWIECIQQRAEQYGRLRWLKQILILCYASFVHDPQQYSRKLIPFKDNVAIIAARFDISEQDLCGNDKMRKWFSSSAKGPDNDYPISATLPIGGHTEALFTPATTTSSGGLDALIPARGNEPIDFVTSTTAVKELDAVPKDIVVPSIFNPKGKSPVRPNQTDPTPQAVNASSTHSNLPAQISSLHSNCEAALKAMASSQNTESPSTEEGSATLSQMFLGLLKDMKLIEESEDFQVTTRDHRDGYLEIYDMLIRMAPAFRKKNPAIVELLETRRSEFLVREAGWTI
ncbi:MAG: hypothetical protein Q9170_001154 [Blastenia crenularia]